MKIPMMTSSAQGRIELGVDDDLQTLPEHLRDHPGGKHLILPMGFVVGFVHTGSWPPFIAARKLISRRFEK
jgi:hypothetical protein